MKNINSIHSLILFAFMALTFSACEDPIEVPSQFEESQLAVDAWLTNTNEAQTITLSETVDYFAGGQAPAVENASVSICNETTMSCYKFVHQGGGRYVWQPGVDETFGDIGDQLSLEIELNDEIIIATTDIARTARIDSIGLDFEEETLALDEGIYAQVYAYDLPGRGDTYWIRTYKNDTLLNRPEEQVVAFDATFDAGADIDGTYFIPPLRFGSTNPLDDEGGFIPYIPGDKIRVEVHSINEVGFGFLNIAIEQILNEGIFASPVANARGNIVNRNTNEPVLGVFNIAQVASLERIVE
ncbi:MAG: hypothetical protein Sapg2KO_38790 [Saprospiraceae bacterium]